MAATYPASQNTFIPSHEATGGMVIEYSRNPKRFALNNYVRIVPVKLGTGYYLAITAEEAARVLNSNGSDYVWHDGAEAPTGDNSTESHEFKQYATARRVYPFALGQKAVAQASWLIVDSHARIHAQQAMTVRTQIASTLLTTSGNWGSNTSAASSMTGGGYWDQSTSTTMFIQTCLLAAAEAINKATLGAVTWGDMIVVMNPTTARRIAKSQELVDQIKQSPFALGNVTGNVPAQNGRWGCPETLYGFPLVIEDAVKVTSRKGATAAQSYIHPDGSVLIVSRPEGLIGSEGVPSFSTVSLFSYEEMTVETKYDPDNRRTEGRIVDDFDVRLTAPTSGYLITSVLSS